MLVASTLVGCASNKGTIGDGAFQKRRLNTGWHVDLGLRSGGRTADHIAQMRPIASATLAARVTPSAEPLASTIPVDPPRPERPIDRLVSMPVTMPVASANEVLTHTPDKPSATSPEDTIGQWNPWAVPAFVVALGTVAYAILGTSEIIVVLAVIATLILASIAVRKGRTNEWRGKGFAIAALMVGALAGLITLIALLAGA